MCLTFYPLSLYFFFLVLGFQFSHIVSQWKRKLLINRQEKELNHNPNWKRLEGKNRLGGLSYKRDKPN